MKDEIFEVVRNLHVAYMGDDRREITQAEANYAKAQETFGKATVQVVQDYYNTEIIGKA